MGELLHVCIEAVLHFFTQLNGHLVVEFALDYCLCALFEDAARNSVAEHHVHN